MLFKILRYAGWILTRDTAVVKLPCDATVKEHLNINCQDLELSIVTPENIADLIATLVACKIEKAQVGGTNVHKIPMVLYSNGALVPYDIYKPVHYALYVYKCGCDYKIVCGVYSTDFKSCKYYEVCYDFGKPYKCYDQVCPVEKPQPYCPPVHKPQPYCPPVQKCDVIVPYCPPKPQPYCPPREECPYYSTNYTKCVTTPSGKRFSKMSVAKTFKYQNPSCLLVYGIANAKSLETIDLRRRNASNIPSILYDYRRLCFIYRELKRRYPGSLVCIFVDCRNCVYAKIGWCLYRVYYSGENVVRTSQVNERDLRLLTKKGLFGVEFNDDCGLYLQ